ncbi:MAG: hypothetical protein AAF431_17525 [Pseudomonadota bacterium]
MFKQIFRLTFITLVWKQYKHVIVSTVILFAYLWLVGSVHADYLSYAEMQEDDSLAGASFLMKWAAFIVGVVVYIGFHWLRGRKEKKSEAKSGPVFSPKSGKIDSFNSVKSKDGQVEEIDPFAEIRAREKLRTRAEIMMEKNKE